ncbi:MAG: S-adenosylmethionine:tRNA ribosyltransferase-isomerase [Nitrospirae bacterium]|nr:S-adenosylmethionine:tRNA ribosyltransferase-isomerase [Candidatus Manganitrophaceae bacterium]
MTAADTKRGPRSETKLLAISKEGPFLRTRHLNFSALPTCLHAGDLLVVNDAATLPASLSGVHLPTGDPIEMRLGGSRSEAVEDLSRWFAIFFGAGDWRTPTENRPLPPPLRRGDRLAFQCGLEAAVEGLLSPDGKLAEINFLGPPSSLWRKVYAAGKPVQYSHLREDLALWDVQTIFSGAPVSLEAPSAAFPFNWERIFALEKKGVRLARLTHAAGLSSTGDERLDRRLPFPERYSIPNSTAAAVRRARSEGRCVIAVGTTVTRALESAVQPDGTVRPGSEITSLKISPVYRRRIVSGILSGFHESGASHLSLLGSFIEPENLEAIYNDAEVRGYFAHEFGDVCLLLSENF